MLCVCVCVCVCGVCVWGGGGGGVGREVKALSQLANFTLGPDATLNTETHKNSVRIKAPNSVMYQSENTHTHTHTQKKPHINHYNKHRRVMANSTVCQSK